MSSVSIAEAKNELPRLIHKTEQGEAVHITRRGKPVAVLLSEDEYNRLTAHGKTNDFWLNLQQWRAQVRSDWPELTPEEVALWRDSSPEGQFSWDD